MRSNGLATILLMIPVLAVPALAIFGVPQFAPVVASPLDEGRDNDRESRVGNSARQSHDELFDDVEGFGSESSTKDDSSSERRDSVIGTGANQKGESRRVRDPVVRWGDDLESDPDASSNPSRRASVVDSTESSAQEPSTGTRNLKRSLTPDRSTRKDRRQSPAGKSDDEVRLASTSEMDQNVSQAGFEDGDLEKPRSAMNGNRSKSHDPRNSKRRELSGGPLTWQVAVERLNELEIHSFRLEPGHQLGQFVFICSYTPPDTPRVSYRFEAGADEPLKAVEKVLEQIVEWQQRR